VNWTASDIPEQTGRRAVVTGANSGIGFAAARELVRAGAEVVLACRDPARGAAAVAALRAELPDARVELGLVDLADLGSVKAFAAALAPGPVDLLINNAGVMATPRRVTVDGFELQLATNHVGHFALTGLILDRLLAAPAPRVVGVSSLLHRSGRIDFDDLQAEHGYRPWRAYSQSKLANLLFSFELDRRARAAGARLASVAAHPGYAATKLHANGPRRPLERLLLPIGSLLLAQSAAAGALPTLRAACDPDVASGGYLGPDGPGERRGSPRLVATSVGALDEQTAARLWEVSEALTGVTFRFHG
jgi:NAD(P)-dependent dehydrogenase (short-subunit alcohol dehydrogenase family)